MTAHDLARAAQTVKESTRRYTPMEPYLPAVDVLRRKNWSWVAIHTWLRAQGQHVQKSPSTFAACMGRSYRRWLSREAARRSPDVQDASLPARGAAEISPGIVPLAEPPPHPPAARIQRRRKKGGNAHPPATGNDATATLPAPPAEPAPPHDEPRHTTESAHQV